MPLQNGYTINYPSSTGSSNFFSSFAPGFGFGSTVGSSLAGFFNQMAGLSDARRERDQAVETSAAVLRNLLGAQIGNQVGQATDVVGGTEDPRSRYLPTGTVMASEFGGGTLGFPLGATGGINPLVVDARRRLYNLLQTQAIQPQDLETQNAIGAYELGGRLNQSAAPSSTDPRASLLGLLNFAGAGLSPAQNLIQQGIANRQFSQQAARSGTQFLNTLMGTAAGVI